MSEQHTKLSLEVGKFWPSRYSEDLLSADITEVGELAILARVFAPKGHYEQQGRANARRLVACWNACRGVKTETLETSEEPLAMGALDSIRTLLDDGNIPRGTFADDQVRNLVAMYNQEKARATDAERLLRSLAEHEAYYRHLNIKLGAHRSETNLAWNDMRAVGDAARAHLAGAKPQEGGK